MCNHTRFLQEIVEVNPSILNITVDIEDKAITIQSAEKRDEDAIYEVMERVSAHFKMDSDEVGLSVARKAWKPKQVVSRYTTEEWSS